MNFIHNDLGLLNGGELVEVRLSSQANVRLMDSTTSPRIASAGIAATTVAVCNGPLAACGSPMPVIGTLQSTWTDIAAV